MDSKQLFASNRTSHGTSFKGKPVELASTSTTGTPSVYTCNQKPAKRAKSVMAAKSVGYEDESCVGCSYILLRVQKLENELADLRKLLQDNITRRNTLSNIPVKKAVTKARKVSKTTTGYSSQCSDAITHNDRITGAQSLNPTDDDQSKPQISSCYLGCYKEPVVESEETNAWQAAMGKHHNRRTKSQSTLMDSLKPSDESLVRGRLNPNESSVNRSRAPKENSGGSENSKYQDRQQCLVIQGLHESTAVRPEDRVTEDLASFNGLLNQLLPPGVEVKVIKAFRIGKKSEDSLGTPRPRPLKIMLESKDQIKAILSKKTNLRHSHKEVFFQPDYSPAERLKRRELVLELQSRLKAGEHNLAIFKGKVVQKNTNFPLNQPIVLRTTAATSLTPKPSGNQLPKEMSELIP